MKRLTFIIICCFHLFTMSANNLSHGQQNETTAVDSISELPLPQVPATLQKPADRANYIIAHFWDAMDFCDTLRSHDKNFMEQNFSNFISVFPYANEQAQRVAVNTLLNKAEANTTAYTLLRDIAEKYLYETNSPMQSEDYYILFLERFVNSTVWGDYGTLRLRRQLDAAHKNRPGMTAADFAYTVRQGTSATLHDTDADGNLLLIFYDPDCEHCKETMNELQADQTLSKSVISGKMKILAIYSGDDYDLWKRTATTLPANWTVGYEPGTLQENGSYVLRAMPTLYLLDHDKKVIQKEMSPEQLFQLLHGDPYNQ